MLKGTKVGFIGGGNMAEALIKGLLAGGVPAEQILVSEPAEERRTLLGDRYGVRTTAENGAAARSCDVLVLAVKPQTAASVLKEISGPIRRETLLISVMAGVTAATMEAALPGARVVRIMPNTPALVLEGASAIAAGRHAAPEDIHLTRAIFDLVGKTWVVEEKLLDAVTGLSGSGPAYVMAFIEALSDAGVKQGLPREVAAGLAVQTVFGAAKLLIETREHPASLREKVTSPGGTTIAGLHSLERDAFRGTVMNAVEAATARSKELGKS
ncbi:pyrroline-5-carboxylate reductase [Geobacter sp. DSM 9736]|uniref:pyrroline-5-carboxylate reductase n=1 Tax=Geobacter sp. DSM 9736 TaxID=1277350 RepID=UPI000B5149CE|nr:pyrroline-5-carboxylate reductase [Geobacter sp. DSM 9736]SNB44715.1 pyrroline-5-carboxylate reductase [Geobacter sp. DSM 9736]